MRVRVLVEDDVPGVATLFARTSPQHGWRSPLECEAYFRHILFDHPWRDLQVPSWAAEDAGRIVGFYALMPRPMSLRGRALLAAVACQIAVDPESRYALVACKLAQACLAGPQDLTLADGANARSRRMWLGIGGSAPALFNLQWLRLLRPARLALALLEEHAAVPTFVARGARPLSVPIDALAARLRWNRCLREHDALADRDLDAGTMLTHLPEVMGNRSLAPVYDRQSLEWVLEEAARKSALGRWRARMVCSDRPLGWYLYYARPGAVSEVVQIAARNGTFGAVLRHLLADAWQQGSAAVRGRLDPQHIDELSDHHCWLRREGTSLLVHSRHGEVLESVRRGEAFLSRLEGEWYLRFLDG